jgi:CRISPR/Cas system-associated exonuclease Cas4 (RecB family)
MNPFLKEIAGELYTSYGDRLEELCLVFPNRRAGLFFNKYLGEYLEAPVWSPTILTIQDLMVSISELDYADEVELISILYRDYSALYNKHENFDDFYFWGEIMVNDFDDVDKYFLDAGDLFRNLEGLKEMERSLDYLSDSQINVIQQFWSTFSTDSLSEQKQQFIDIWNILGPLYKLFTASLRNEKIGYEGMIYRDVAEKIKTGEDPDLPAPTIVFIGFNALNKCEEILAAYLQKSGRALFYWDFDTYYTSRDRHEAGRFIRSNLEKFPDSGTDICHTNMESHTPEVEVFSIPSDSGQAQVISKILAQSDIETSSGEETAIVLADEELLMPVLHALPEGLKEINVTMGYPVNATPVFSLIEHLINLQKNTGSPGGKGKKYYHEDVLKVLQHQYISLRYQEEAKDLVQDIHKKNRIYLPMGDLGVNELFSKIFQPLQNPEEIAGYLLGILEIISGVEGEEEKQMPALELEFIYRIYTRIKRLNDVLGRLELSYGLPTFLKIFHKYLQRTSIPFTGEPLAGLQVMGVLETRGLDFKHVIIMSMNEGAFPKTSASHSFIPHNLRHGFGLPTLDHQDAIYAYYFYRLIQRAERVSMIYNNKTEGLSTGERSRYIYQLQYDNLFRVREISSGFDIQTTNKLPIYVEKSSTIMEIISRFYNKTENEKYLSPSALNSLISCSLRFYFRYVVSLREPDLLSKEIDSAMFGTLLHDVMKNIYEGMDWPLREEEIKRFIKDEDRVGDMVDESFRKLFKSDNSHENYIEGRNIIIRSIIQSYVNRILEIDMESCPLDIFSLEEEYCSSIPIDLASGKANVRIGGKIDRIDISSGTYRVLDYKSGTGDLHFKSIEELFNGETENRNEAAFQTFLYSKIFKSSQEIHDSSIKPGLYLARKIFSTPYIPDLAMGTEKKNIPVEDYADYDEEFTEKLTDLLESLFNPEVPFKQTLQEAHCKYCEFKGICHR